MRKSIYWCVGSVYCNPLGPPVNLWTTGTVGRQFVLSVHCVIFVSVVSLSVWAEMHVRVWLWDQFCDISVCKVSSCSHTAECTLMQLGLHQTQHLLPDRDLSFCTAWPVACYFSTWNRLRCWVEERQKHKPAFQKSEEVILTGERTFALDPHCMKHRNKRKCAFPFSPTDCIWTYSPQQQISWASPWNPNIVMRLKLKKFLRKKTCTVSSKFYSTGSPLTAGSIGKE